MIQEAALNFKKKNTGVPRRELRWQELRKQCPSQLSSAAASSRISLEPPEQRSKTHEYYTGKTTYPTAKCANNIHEDFRILWDPTRSKTCLNKSKHIAIVELSNTTHLQQPMK